MMKKKKKKILGCRGRGSRGRRRGLDFVRYSGVGYNAMESGL